MREIKFRAWDKKRNKWASRDNIQVNGVGIIGWQFGYEYQMCSHTDFDLMLSTGLKDKNGKEIYEGDILSMHKGQYNSQVIYDTDQFVADHIGNGGSESITTWIEDCEIIGNIYENPELLK